MRDVDIAFVQRNIEALMVLFLGPFREWHGGRLHQDDVPSSELEARMVVRMLEIAETAVNDIREDAQVVVGPFPPAPVDPFRQIRRLVAKLSERDDEDRRMEEQWERDRRDSSDRKVLLGLLLLWLMVVLHELVEPDEGFNDGMWPCDLPGRDQLLSEPHLPGWTDTNEIFVKVRAALPPGETLPQEALALLRLTPFID